MKVPYLCTSMVHQYGGQKIVLTSGTWLSMRLIICTEQTSIYISPFPNALTSKKIKNHEIYFKINVTIVLCHAPPLL